MPDAVSAALTRTGLSQPKSVTRSLVRAAVDTVLKPWWRQLEIEKIIKAASDELPWRAKNVWEPSPWQTRVASLARQAISQLDESLPISEVRRAARLVVSRVTREFEYSELCERLVSGTYLSDATSEEMERAREAIGEELAGLPVDTSEAKLKQAAERILMPLREKIHHREDQRLRGDVIRHAPIPQDVSKRQRQLLTMALQKLFAQLPERTPRQTLEELRDSTLAPFLTDYELRRKKAKLIALGRSAVFPYLLRHSAELPPGTGATSLSDELEDPIAKELARELTGDESTRAVEERVAELVREH